MRYNREDDYWKLYFSFVKNNNLKSIKFFQSKTNKIITLIFRNKKKKSKYTNIYA